jgi:alpha-L-fucosidase
MFDRSLDALGSPRYLPPECDVSIRDGWFWHPHEVPKSLEHLLDIWYRSVGLGANLLLNVPPNPAGLIDDADRARIAEWALGLRRRFADPIPGAIVHKGGTVDVTFPESVTIDHLWLEEAIANGQRVRSHRIVDAASGGVIVEGVHTVGSQRVHAFPPVTTDRIHIEVDDPAARLDAVIAYRTRDEAVPAEATGNHASPL